MNPCGADGFTRMFGHADHARGRMDGQARPRLGARMGERRLNDFGFADEDELERGIGGEGTQRAGYAFRRTAVTTHYVDGDGRHVKTGRGSMTPAASYSSASTSAGFSMTRLRDRNRPG